MREGGNAGYGALMGHWVRLGARLVFVAAHELHLLPLRLAGVCRSPVYSALCLGTGLLSLDERLLHLTQQWRGGSY